LLLFAVLLGLTTCGCGAETSAPPSSDNVVLETKRVSADSLPIGGHMPPMDEQRVVLAPPRDWYAAPRRRGYVVQFYLDKTRQSRIPRIWVTAEDSPYDALQTVDLENLDRFVQLVAERLENEGIELLEPVRPMVLGDNPCARYVRLTEFVWKSEGRKRRITAERQILELLVNGRLYTVDLHVPSRRMLEYRDAGYAVAASMQFPQMSAGGDASGGKPDEAPESEAPEFKVPEADGAAEAKSRAT
jgi:hypothetical protein